MRTELITAAILSAALAVSMKAQAPVIPESRPPADSADVATPDAIIAALYESISGPAGEPRDWERLRSLTHPEGRLMPTFRPQGSSNHAVLVWSVEEYLRRVGNQLERNGFFEREIGRVEESFGNIMHIFSAYESRNTPDGPVIARGINSIQLVNDGNRWWILNILWDSERPDNQIPERYLN